MEMLASPPATPIMELVIMTGMARLAPRLEFLGNEGELAPKGPRGGASPLYPEMEDGSHRISQINILFPPLAAEIFLRIFPLTKYVIIHHKCQNGK